MAASCSTAVPPGARPWSAASRTASAGWSWWSSRRAHQIAIGSAKKTARTAASTTRQIGAVRAFADRSPAHYASLLAAVRKAAERFVDALAATRARDAIAAIRAAGESLEALGQAADVAIVTPAFARAAAIAAELGGAAKPSGAGGGDVGVGLFIDRASADAFAERLGRGAATGEAAGTAVDVLDLRVDDRGLHRRSAGIARVEQHV